MCRNEENNKVLLSYKKDLNDWRDVFFKLEDLLL